MSEPHNPTQKEILEAELGKELEKWRVLGIDPSGWTPSDGFLGIALRLDVMNEFLVEAGIINMEEADLKMIRLSRERLEDIRKMLEPAIVEAKLQAIRNGDLRKQ